MVSGFVLLFRKRIHRLRIWRAEARVLASFERLAILQARSQTLPLPSEVDDLVVAFADVWAEGKQAAPLLGRDKRR